MAIIIIYYSNSNKRLEILIFIQLIQIIKEIFIASETVKNDFGSFASGFLVVVKCLLMFDKIAKREF